MKIERVSENQIKCTLTSEDLASRQIRLTELAYGNEKTRALFQDMMQQAYYDLGFEASNSPLMIEAIPMPSGSITLLITKVDSPEELDGRFSRFSPEEDSAPGTEGIGSLGDLIDFFARLTQSRKGSSSSVPAVPGQEGLDSVAEAMEEMKEEGSLRQEPPSRTALQAADSPAAGNTDETGQTAQADAADPAHSAKQDEKAQAQMEAQLYNLTRFYLFRDLPTVIRASRAAESFDGISSLYKNPEDENYYLLLQKAEAPDDQFNRVCNLLSEYALSVDFIQGIEELFGEHMDTILRGQALADLRSL